MSSRRVIIGLLICGSLLALGFIAYWHFDLSEKSVHTDLFVLILVGVILVQLREQNQVQKTLNPYWQRVCAGIRWRRRFPSSSKSDIRDFLSLVVDSFGFPKSRRCCFRPDDKVMDLYHALHPPGSWIDDMELDTLCASLEKRYRIDFTPLWREDITLGEIYERTSGSVV